MLLKSKQPITPIELYIVNLDRTIEVEGGITLYDIGTQLSDELGFEPIVACVNNKNEGLYYQVYGPKKVEFLSKESSVGRRVYTHSLCMMLYHAITKTFRGAYMRVEFSISNGLLISIPGVAPTVDNARILKACMRKLTERNIPFVHHCIAAEKAIELFETQGLRSKVMLLKTIDNVEQQYYTLDDVADNYYGCLAPRTGMIDVYDLTVYNDVGFLLRIFDKNNPSEVPPTLPQPTMYEAYQDHLDFNRIVGVSNIGEFNNVVLHGRPADLINLGETLHNNRLSAISDSIARRYREGGARVVLIAGPSSSGKTTTTKRLAIQLMTHLLKPVMISLDNYFVERVNTPLDADGEYDFESIYALDLELLNRDLNRILAGEEVEVPYYNFETGKRQYKGHKIRLEEGSVLMMEGLHGLNPELTAQIPAEMKFHIYVSAMTTLSIDNHNWIPTTDNRLLRRIIRDYNYRGTSAIETIRRWPSVCRGEDKWITPFIDNADAIFNSSLLFEMGVIKEYAERILARVPSNCPEYALAHRLRRFLHYFRQVRPDSIPPTSLLREFLGGSSFKY